MINIRPLKLTDMVGQENLIGTNGIITNMLKTNNLKSLIFYGPPGTGKTTVANIIADSSKCEIFKINATDTSITDIKNMVKNAVSKPVLLYLDEIQYFNKKQQQSLLPMIENNDIILIAATTENPYHAIYDALLSRCLICEFKYLNKDDITNRLSKIISDNNIKIEKDATEYIAEISQGDMRRAINTLDAINGALQTTITKTDIKNILPSINMNGFDTNSDFHYSLISALQKSIRCSDVNASVFYLMKLLEGGDILSPIRRLLVIANEDIGLAYPEALSIVYSLTETAKVLGLPEAAKPLTNATILLALSPKSSTCENTYMPILEDIKNGLGKEIPKHINKTCPKDYVFPHDFKNHWVPQQYLPDDIKDKTYYTPGDNSFEEGLAKYWNNIKSEYYKNKERKD